MADQSLSSRGVRRAAVYSYLRPVIDGKRVLEVGCGTGEAAAHLVRLDAKSVVGAGSAQEVAEARGRSIEGTLGFTAIASGGITTPGTFDLVLVPEAESILHGASPVRLSSLLSKVASGGQLVCVVANGDRGDGVPYYDLVDALSPHFSRVRMFGQTRFVAYGIAEFDEVAGDLRVDTALAEGAEEEPSHYIALAGPDQSHGLGYALMQIPAAEGDAVAGLGHERAMVGSGTAEPANTLAELRRRLTESEGKAEGLVRVSRAQTEEIEELRARLRRTAEARSELDEEVRRLRKALIEADESVVNLTRKTTEEMTALAQRLTSGLRDGGMRSARPFSEEGRRADEQAERESGISERDDRIAALEVAKQEALWRADAAEDELGRMRAELIQMRADSERRQEGARRQADVSSATRSQEATVEEFRRAAAVHLEEVNRLRDAANEQTSLVTELEDELRASESSLRAAKAELTQLQQALAETEEADRARRSRLAELEGLMLRAEHATTRSDEGRERVRRELEDWRARAENCRTEVERLRGLLAEVEHALALARSEHAHDKQLLASLEQEAHQNHERDRRLAELRAEAPDPEEAYQRLLDLETQYQAATMAAARVPELEAKVAELEMRLGEKSSR